MNEQAEKPKTGQTKKSGSRRFFLLS